MSRASRPADQPRGRYIRTLFPSLLMIGVIVIPWLILHVITMGAISGEELSRDTLRRRKFSYFEIPFLRIQVTGVNRTPIPDDLVTHLTVNKYLIARQESPQNWDLVRGSRGSLTSFGEAAIFAMYVEAGTETRVWLDWSNKNPSMAAVLWPVVIDVVRDEMYVLLPDIFRLATESSDAASLRARLPKLLGEGYVRRAKTVQSLAQQNLAESLFATAAKYQLENEPAKQELEGAEQESKF